MSNFRGSEIIATLFYSGHSVPPLLPTGPVNSILSYQCWQPLSRITFSIYLIHLPIIFMVFYSFHEDIYATHTVIVSYFIIQIFLLIYFIHIATLLNYRKHIQYI